MIHYTVLYKKRRISIYYIINKYISLYIMFIYIPNFCFLNEFIFIIHKIKKYIYQLIVIYYIIYYDYICLIYLTKINKLVNSIYLIYLN